MVLLNQKGVIFSASKQSCMSMPVKQHSLTRLKKTKTQPSTINHLNLALCRTQTECITLVFTEVWSSSM